MTNHEEAARNYKAGRLTGTLLAMAAEADPGKALTVPEMCAIVLDLMATMDDYDWAEVASEAGVKPPSGQTIELVTHLLRGAIGPITVSDPFAGLPS